MSSTAKTDFAKFSSRRQRNARTLRAYMALRNQEIAERIKALREAKGNPPQPVVATAVHVALRTYQNWEAGDAKPEYRNLEALAAYFGVSEEYILTGNENATVESPVVVSAQVSEGFDEFRQYVRDIRRDIAESHQQRAQEADAIRGLLERQTAILASIEQLLTRQDEILHEIQRVAGGLPTDGELAGFRKDLAALEARAEVGRGQGDGPAGTAGTARRQGQGH